MTAPPVGVHEHDGFYLRMALGLGHLGARFGSDESAAYGGKVTGTLGGGSGALELALGGSPMPGLVLGGGLYLDGGGKLRTNVFEVDGTSAGQVQYDQVSLGLLGPFVDYFFDAKSGWHLQGALGYAWMNVGPATRDGVTVAKKSLGGVGFEVGGGYEWWIASQWSLGVLLRGTFVAVANNANDGERWSYESLAVPELLLSVTYQ